MMKLFSAWLAAAHLLALTPVIALTPAVATEPPASQTGAPAWLDDLTWENRAKCLVVYRDTLFAGGIGLLVYNEIYPRSNLKPHASRCSIEGKRSSSRTSSVILTGSLNS